MKNNKPEYTIELIEQDEDIPKELAEFATGDSWAIIRTHDDELIAIYDTKEEAEAAILEGEKFSASLRAK